MDYSAIGDTTNVSARLQAIAAPGTILVTDATARLVQGTIRLEPLPPVEVKGKEEPVGVFNVIGPLPQRSPISSRGDRTLSTFVGRERELATLDELLIQVENGQGQVVGIVAEAGQGKSRLLYEFRERLEGKPVTYLDGRCLSYGQASPYHPITNIVRHHCGVVETDRPETISAKVHTVLQEVGMDPEQSVPYLLQLLGVQEGTESIAMLTPEAVRMRTFDTLRQMSVSGAQQHPLIVEVEDLHWVDQTSEAYLMFLVENLAGAKILLLTSYRPGYQPPWLDKSYATQLSLQHLAPQEALTIVHSTDPGGVLPITRARMIINKPNGNQ
jgi:predicted ATPase